MVSAVNSQMAQQREEEKYVCTKILMERESKCGKVLTTGASI